MRRDRCRSVGWVALAAALSASGCLNAPNRIPSGRLPPPAAASDVSTSSVLGPAVPRPMDSVKPGKGFELPPGLPGTNQPPVKVPVLPKDMSAAEREKAVRAAYPKLTPAAAVIPQTGGPLSLADLQQIALTSSPVIVRAKADLEASYGQVVQAGLHPNPTIGYEADQVTPGPHPPLNNAGQQGAFLNQLLKFPGKLSLARAVAGFDYVNAHIALRRAEIDVMAAVRSNYFSVLVARESMTVTRRLIEAADEVYRLQLLQVGAGEAAGYEPLQFHAQAVQARNALAQAEASYRSNWRQLTAALGTPDLPPTALDGQVDLPVPPVEFEAARAGMLEYHTDMLTVLNKVTQAQVNLRLQRLTPVPDMTVNVVAQHDNALRLGQFNLQLGLPIPVYDRNQGNIRAAEARIASTTAAARVTANDLTSRLAEAYGRYEANRQIVLNYRDKILPSLTQSYRGLVRRYQTEPGKVGFSDVVVGQQNLAQALQNYLTSLNSLWQSVVDLAALTQVDELYLNDPRPVRPPEKGK